MAVSTATLAKAVPKIPSVVVPPAPEHHGAAQAVLPATGRWSFNNSPAPFRHDANSHEPREFMQHQNAVWKKHGVAKIVDASDCDPTCDSGRVLSHVVMLEFPPDFSPG